MPRVIAVISARTQVPVIAGGLLRDKADVMAAMRKEMTEILEEEGYEVVTTYSGDEAWETFERISPDLVLLDFRMPGLKDRKSTRLNSSHIQKSRMPSSA